MRFNLVTEPWVRCSMLTGEVRELSLAEVFETANRIRRLAGELPTQDYAVLRVLLAIAYRAMPEVDPVDTVTYWRRVWEDPGLFRRLMADYLAEVAARFDLFDPVQPFMQVADLHTASGKYDGVARLIADVPSGHQYFTTRAGAGLDSLGFAEAARWLIHTQAFDPSGIKSGAVGDDRVKGGRGYPIGTGWAGKTGGIYFEGDSLRETLLLNLDMRLVAAEGSGDDLPVWERPPLAPAVEPRPRGWRPQAVDVMTWPSRRVRLFPSEGRVTRVLVSNGDPLAPQNMTADPLTAMRYSKPQSTKFKESVHMPREHDAERMVWSGIGSMLVQRETTAADKDGNVMVMPAPIATWVSRLVDVGAVDGDRMLNARLVGVQYGTQSSIIESVMDDSLAVHLGLLAEAAGPVAAVAETAAAETANAIWALGGFAGDLVRAAGGDPATVRDAERQAAFFDVDGPYRAWVTSLTGRENPDEARETWNGIARSVLRRRSDRLIDLAAPAAVIGRLTAEGKLLSVATAERWFMAALRKHLPFRSDERAEGTPGTDETLDREEGMASGRTR
ncbi:type I-E CRISPR-associated protein Cse1/CasA [Specibacter cremeus]|uniref:type I-E CRISPR-associated protein Cse1/CasA n=1 Tax=Specibacter cremeus TaxID=1629051 RepID=UPI0013DE5F5A|nr:type I-E CRISPR-associated protein Cse1/CasA [Specibacter cremeus]